MIIERPVYRGKEIELLWNPGEQFNNFFFSNGGGRKKLADQVREWEFNVRSLRQAELRVAEMHERSAKEGLDKRVRDFCDRYRVTEAEFFAMSALSQEDRSDLTQILASGEASNYQHALELLAQFRQQQDDNTEKIIDGMRDRINYPPQGGRELGEEVVADHRAEYPWKGWTKGDVQRLYEKWVEHKRREVEYLAASDSSFDRFQSEWLLAQQGNLQEHVSNPFPFP